jgi:cytoskeletal protein CcmA (bactofilin family)
MANIGPEGALIAGDAVVSGKVRGKDLTVLGGLEGEVTLTGRLRIGREGRVKAKVRAKEVVVEGEVEGEVQADSLSLLETSRARGTFVSKQFIVKEGAVLQGNVNPAGAEPALPKVPLDAGPTEKPVEKSAEKPAEKPPEKPAEGAIKATPIR